MEPATSTAGIRHGSTRPVVLVVAPWLYHLKCGIGGGVLCFHMLRALSEHCEIHWLSFDHTSNDPEAGKRALGEFCASVSVVPVPGHVGRVRAVVDLVVRGIPRPVQNLASRAMHAEVRAACERAKPDVVLLQFPFVAQYIDAVPAGIPTVMDVQDACIVSRYREWRRADTLREWLRSGLGWIAWFRHEVRMYGRANALLALSETDQGVLDAFVPDVPVLLSPVGTDIPASRREPRGARVVFIGNFGHAPNRDALRWLLEDLWDRIRALHPAAVLQIAGPGCPPQTEASRARGVEMLGFVDDFETFMAEAAVAIVPYRFGGGVKIKALEALARAVPVVATAVGAEGLHVSDGLQMRVADDADAFARAVAESLDDPPTAEQMGRAGRDHVMRRFSWASKTSGVLELIERLRTGPPAHEPPARRSFDHARQVNSSVR
jgi:glycosyltransferase involved in cell wall biosynthesis